LKIKKRIPLLSRERLRTQARAKRERASAKQKETNRSHRKILGGPKGRGGSKAAILQVGHFGTTPRGIGFAIPLPS